MNAVLPIVVLAIGGFLLGGVYAMWRTAKIFALILLVLALLAVAGGILWLISG